MHSPELSWTRERSSDPSVVGRLTSLRFRGANRSAGVCAIFSYFSLHVSFINDGIMNFNFILLLLLGPILAQKQLPNLGPRPILSGAAGSAGGSGGAGGGGARGGTNLQHRPKCPQWSLKELVLISPLIVEASVVSHGDIDPKTDTFQVTFKVKKVYKTDQGTVWLFDF